MTFKKRIKKYIKNINKRMNGKKSIILWIIIGKALLLYGIVSFWIGLHNMDLCHNETSIEQQVNLMFCENEMNNLRLTLTEQLTNGDTWSLSTCYLSGMHKVVNSIVFIVAGSFLFGAYLSRASEVIENGN